MNRIHLNVRNIHTTPAMKANLTIVATILGAAAGKSYSSGHFDRSLFLAGLIAGVTGLLPSPYQPLVAKVQAALGARGDKRTQQLAQIAEQAAEAKFNQLLKTGSFTPDQLGGQAQPGLPAPTAAATDGDTDGQGDAQ